MSVNNISMGELSMKNNIKGLKYEVKGKKLVIEVDLDRINRLGEEDLSSSGKSYIVGTTGGNIKLDGEYSFVSLGVNCFASKDYIAGRKEIARQKELFRAESKKDEEINALKGEMAELKAMLAAALKAAAPAEKAEVKTTPATAKAGK
jgi:hypothetical protein